MRRRISLLLCAAMLLSVLCMFPVCTAAEGTVDARKYENGMENWAGSPNKGDEDAVTQILFCPSYDGEWNTSYFYAGLPVVVTMTSASSSQTFDAHVATIYDGGSWGICRIEPCLLGGTNKFVPVKDEVYTASFTFQVDGGDYTVTLPDYVLDVDPIDPDAVKELDIEPAYNEIENYNGRTCFIVGGTNAAIADRLRDGRYALRVRITDESEGKTCTITRYEFDHPSDEIYYDGSFLRLAVCEYGIVPVYGHGYTVALTIFDAAGKLKYTGVSQIGAFDRGDADFTENGAIVPADPPHTCEGQNRFSRFDLDGSDSVSISDITVLLDALSGAGALAEGQTGDFDGSGTVSINDVAYFLNVLTAGFSFTRNEADDGWILTGVCNIEGEIAVPALYRGEPVTQIARSAFEYCRAIKKLTVPACATWINPGSFSGCTGLKKIFYGGKPSTFYAGGVRLPEGCVLICAQQDDLIDTVDLSGAIELTDLSGYDGILRVKTTGELLFSPTLTELRDLVAAGESYGDFTAFLRFSDGTYTYPTVTVEPKKSKGSFVDFFLQGDGIDCGFCPTAGVTYAIEFVLVRNSAPETALYYGTYTATAPAKYEESPWYAPSPVGVDGEEPTFLLRYRASAGGSIEGAADQYLKVLETSSPVTAVPDEGYEFVAWSDGVSTAERSGDSVARNMTLTAHFARVYHTNLACVYIYTADGNPILTKEYAEATLVIRGARQEKYNVTLPMTIKGRGNSSWNASAPQTAYDSKNSYSIKLAEKAQLLGIGNSKSKKWVLNANKFDASGLRNYLVWDFAARMDSIGYTTENDWVQLYVNDEYRGMYMLTEKIDTGKDRVNVNDDPSGDPDKGYLMELDFRGQNETDPWFDIDGYGPDPAQSRYDAVEFVVKSDIEGQQDLDFIRNYVQKCHNAIMSGDRATIEEWVNLPSLIDMYIIEELSKDCDAGRASFYICKDKGGKLYFTAPWDFDFGFGTYGPATNTSGLVSTGSNCCTWFASLITRSWFREAVLARMNELAPALEATLSAVEDKAAYLKDDADRNAEFWNLYGNHYHAYVSGQTSSRLHNYDEHVDFIINWTKERWANLKTAIGGYS